MMTINKKRDSHKHAVEGNVVSRLFSKDDSEDAEEKYVEAEKEATQIDELVVALVSSMAVGGVKEAYPNYFADSTEFMKLVNIIFLVKI